MTLHLKEDKKKDKGKRKRKPIEDGGERVGQTEEGETP